MSSVKSSEPNRLALLAAKLLRSVSAPLVVAVLGAVVLITIAAVIAGSIGSP
jgi:hypothetical protein